MSLSKPNEKTRYRNQGSFSQPFRPTGYPPTVISPSRTRDSGGSTSSAQSGTPSEKPTDYEIAVRSILGDIGVLDIFTLEPLTMEPAPAAAGPTAATTPPSEEIPGATLLNDWRKDHRKELAAGVFNTETRKVRGLHTGLISSPLEAGRVSLEGIQEAGKFGATIASASPFASFKAYDFAPQQTDEEDREFYAHLAARVNRARAGSDATSSMKRCSSGNSTEVGERAVEEDVGPAGPVGPAVEDLTPEKLSAIRRQNSEEYGW